MSNKKLSTIKPLLSFIAIIIFLSYLLTGTGCNSKEGAPKEGFKIDTVRAWNWNIFFGTSTTDSLRADIRTGIEDSIVAYVKRKAPGDSAIMKWSYCPCDTLLANLDVTIVGVSTGGITPPPTKPPIGPSGDYAIDSNINIEIPEASEVYHQNIFYDSLKYQMPGLPSGTQPNPDNRLFAIIDTGLDTTAFATSLKNLIWTDPADPKKTLFNFLKPDGLDTLSDSNLVKHGTSATAIALGQITNQSKPRIMALKAFDKNGKGTIYSVSCALSYAIKNRASLINASWGYYGKEIDPVLNYYIKRADRMSVPIIAAAGNTLEPPGHARPYCGNNPVPGNELTGTHQFFPAFLSPQFPNLVTVTGLSQSSTTHTLVPCLYQNYSNTIVSIGVWNKDPQNCCQYRVSFLGSPIEGTSFATPVVSGRYLSQLQTGVPTTARTARDIIDLFSSHVNAPTPFYTVNGRYIGYLP
ncbi:MAG: S8 family serine peptidase [Chitinophagales bacterium]